MAQTVKRLPTRWEICVQSLGQEDALEKDTATHSSTLAWKILWTEEPGGLHSPRGHKESDMTEQLHVHTHIYANILPNSTTQSTKNIKEDIAIKQKLHFQEKKIYTENIYEAHK